MLIERRHLLLGFVLVALVAGVCNAEEQGSEAADREAAVLALVVALDQTMLLNDQQREDLLVLLSNRWQGQWRTPRTWPRLIHPGCAPWQNAMTRAAFAVLDMDESELAPVLRPAQLAVYHELRVYAYATAIQHRNVIAPRQPMTLFELSLDDVVATCELSDEQHARLRLAGKSDVKRLLESVDWTSRFHRENEQGPAAPVIDEPSLPAGTLSDDLPRYRKALTQWLTAEQRQRIEAAHQRRRRFERRSELASVLRIVRRDAQLTESQCDRLSDWLDKRLNQQPNDDGVAVRADLLLSLSRLSPDEVAGAVRAEKDAVADVWQKLHSEVEFSGLAKTLTLRR